MLDELPFLYNVESVGPSIDTLYPEGQVEIMLRLSLVTLAPLPEAETLRFTVPEVEREAV